MKKVISCIMVFVIVVCANFLFIGCKVVPDYKEYFLDKNGDLYYNSCKYSLEVGFDNDYKFIEPSITLDYADWTFPEKENYEFVGQIFRSDIKVNDELYYIDAIGFYKSDIEKNIARVGRVKYFLKEGFELKDKYDATITSINVKNVNRELNADITLPTNLTLKDIIDTENKIESIPQEVPYYFIDMRVEEYSYLCIYEVLRVYNGEVYINLTPSREDNTRYNYPIKEEYKNYFASVIEWNNNV